ncbi:MAG: hypothetical protein LC104_11410 [Bacteroidales bacterium]|nr:hypothetical protein [Bacteroidales bacterium]
MSTASTMMDKNLPPCAGLCSLEQATQPGLPLEECVRRLKRMHYMLKRLHGIFVARLTAEPIYELKMAFAHHAHLCAEHITAIRNRVAEMREPPLGLEEVPHPALERFFDEILCAPTTEERLCGIYTTALGALQKEVSVYLQETHPLTDAPSRRLLRFAQIELEEMSQYGQQAIAALVKAESINDWQESILQPLLQAASCSTVDAASLPRRYSITPYRYDPIPQRDERFTDPWNQGVNAEVFLYHPDMPARAKVLMMLYKRLREIDVPEMMASIIVETSGKPWGYYRDMTRQLWDEARHALMGEVGFHALGVDWTQAKVTFNWSYRLNTECNPLERHGVLFFIEQGLMPKTGKRYEWEVAQESGLSLAATIQDFDWADEVLHSQIGRQWYVPEFESLQKALDFGDAAWSKILSNWTTVKEQGLTQHENWWPGIYEQMCRSLGEQPDSRAVAFAETYEGQRADLQRIAGE